MERYDNIVKIEEIRRLVENSQYEKAMKILDTMDIVKIKALTDLSIIADVYTQSERYEEAMEVLTKIYGKTKTRRVLYQLVDLSIRRGNVSDAEEYLEKYIKAAPMDPNRYILRYWIDKLNQEPYEVLIESLEKLKEYEYYEMWAYELAKLYHKAGMKDKCVRECSDIILWFGDGIYVEKARLLKGYYVGEINPVHMLKAKEKKEAEKKFGLDKTKDFSVMRSQIDQFLAEEDTSANGKPDMLKTRHSDYERDMENTENNDPELQAFFKKVARKLERDVMHKNGLEHLKKEIENSGDGLENAEKSSENGSVPNHIFHIVRKLDTDLENEESYSKDQEDKEETQYLEVNEEADEKQNYEMKEEAEEEQYLGTTEENQYNGAEEIEEDQYLGITDELQKSDDNEVKKEVTDEKIITEQKEIIPLSDVENNKTNENEIEVMKQPVINMEKNQKESRYTPDKFDSIFSEAGMNYEKDFGYFVNMDSCRNQIESCLESILSDYSKTNHIVVIGERKTGKTTLAKKISKALYGLNWINTNRIAKISASKLNGISLESKKDKLINSSLIIEEAGLLDSDAVEQLVSLIQNLGENIFVILEDNQKGMKNLFDRNPNIGEIFGNMINLPEYSKEDLSGFAFTYIRNNDYEFTREVKIAFEKEIERIINVVKNEDRLEAVMELAKRTKTSADKRNKSLLSDIIHDRDLSSEDFLYIKKEDFI
ncbi:hypothetical protein [Anaerocolumna sp. MB42-C2]|uniref:hypothetical protein n=1 Tax=Anaerocolumna sp. MB42-C2 TaxID=3070997 RepID=UPI0027E1AB3F|nr:hypothetical protein [Anaerocolumna sp. MB42-C2]WMJ85312.1 hypothetical protein RBU59_14600 [Anaerocolumna sp. MB42-C2]